MKRNKRRPRLRVTTGGKGVVNHAGARLPADLADATGLSEAAQREITEVIERHHGELLSVGNPSSTLEELFLNIIAESEARPGRRVRAGGNGDAH